MKHLSFLLILASILGCGNGTHPAAIASGGGLSYQNPSGEGWRLMQDESSSKGRLVLALVGPADTLTRGASITLLVDQNLAAFSPFANGSYLESTGQYVSISQGKLDEARSLQLVVGAAMGNKLTVGIFQKDIREPAKRSDLPLFRIALVAVPGTPAQTPVSLLLRKACMVPDDLAAANYLPIPIPVTIGRLTVD